MINTVLLTSLLLYILSLCIGFSIHKDTKKKLNKQYHKFKPILISMISIIFLYTLIILYYGTTQVQNLYYLLGIVIAFILYFYIFYPKNTRCWKQHRMVFFNFIVIVINYYISLLANNMYLNFFVFFILLYTILEFQFAKFSVKQPFAWD